MILLIQNTQLCPFRYDDPDYIYGEIVEKSSCCTIKQGKTDSCIGIESEACPLFKNEITVKKVDGVYNSRDDKE